MSGVLVASLWMINNRVVQLVICRLEYNHLSPSSTNVTEACNYYKYS